MLTQHFDASMRHILFLHHIFFCIIHFFFLHPFTALSLSLLIFVFISLLILVMIFFFVFWEGADLRVQLRFGLPIRNSGSLEWLNHVGRRGSENRRFFEEFEKIVSRWMDGWMGNHPADFVVTFCIHLIIRCFPSFPLFLFSFRSFPDLC